LRDCTKVQSLASGDCTFFRARLHLGPFHRILDDTLVDYIIGDNGASAEGGTRNGAILHWPDGIQSKDEVRQQFSHVIDVAPTVLEAAGLPQPVVVNSVQQKPLEGVSMAYSFDDARAAERHETQYFSSMALAFDVRQLFADSAVLHLENIDSSDMPLVSCRIHPVVSPAHNAPKPHAEDLFDRDVGFR
jgi:hypothetical protein